MVYDFIVYLNLARSSLPIYLLFFKIPLSSVLESLHSSEMFISLLYNF